MRALYVALVFLFALQARAQLEEPGEVIQDPYAQCVGCQMQLAPMVLELQRLQRARPSMFWPTVSIVAGASAIGLGLLNAVDNEGEQVAPCAAAVAVGAVVLTAGIMWRGRRAKERAPIDLRISQLRMALRAYGYRGPAATYPPYAAEIEALRAQRPSLLGPIMLTSFGIATVVSASLLTIAMSLPHSGERPYAQRVIPGEVALFSVGAAALIGGAVWWQHNHQIARAYNLRIRSLRGLDLSGAPFLIRW